MAYTVKAWNEFKNYQSTRFIVRNYGDAQFIVVKEPRTTLLLDLWREALEGEGYRVSYVIMVRRPDEVAQSLKARDGTVMNKALITWTTYMLAAELGTRGKSRVFVNFDDLLIDPEEVLNRLETHLDVSFPRRTWESALQTQEFLKSDSKHHTSSRWPRQFKQFTQIERFYAYLAASSRDEPWNADIADEVALWLSQLENVFGPILKQSERELDSSSWRTEQVEDALTQSRATHEVALSDLRVRAPNCASSSWRGAWQRRNRTPRRRGIVVRSWQTRSPLWDRSMGRGSLSSLGSCLEQEPKRRPGSRTSIECYLKPWRKTPN